MSYYATRKFFFGLATVGLIACSSTASEPKQATSSLASNIYTPVVATNTQSNITITLEKIMSDPDWIGRQPEQAYWGDDSQSVYFSRKQKGSVVRDRFRIDLTQELASPAKVALTVLQHQDYASRVLNADKSQAAWISDGDVFVKDLGSGDIRQYTKGISGISQLQFLLSGELAYFSGDNVYSINLESGLVSLIGGWKFAEKPTPVKPPKDYIAEEQQKLIGYIQTKRRQATQWFNQQNAVNDATGKPQHIYLKKGYETVQAKLSPNGKQAIVMLREDKERRTKTDIMPHYIQEDGRIAAIDARRRVADAEPVNHELWLLDLENTEAHELSFETLPGYNDDVLASVKAENANAQGKKYEKNRLPRHIHLQMNWEAGVDEILWNKAGTQAAIMLEAWDNKDRWLVTVDFDKNALVTQHRLHDDAWINYRFNAFGWMNHSDTLYYLSEESGYANLYTKPLKGKSKALVTGEFEVNALTLTANDGYIYYQANKVHPGMYEIYRVDVNTGQSERLTQLLGNTQYTLSPDETQLMLEHSKVTMPPELYVQAAQPNASAKRITHTVSDEFLAMPWTAPDIVPVESSHVEKPVYARVYRPKVTGGNSAEKHRAVIFNHGAGYLQNSHLGWSGYFREFMFHSMLAQQGYVVMDMDYRASAGYGRDWRTAIYRHMGKPEIDDLEDGVNWLVKNANVDRQRIGTYGGSYGGFMTFMALFTKPELFQAGAALRPVSDWAHYNEQYTSNILNTPEVDPIAYERSSPIYFAEGLQKPLLINAPMVDDNVFFVDVVRLVQRMIELEKQNFETAIYPVEPHGFVQPSSWLDEYRRIYKLFEENL
ncbi:S9 family peptidase [Alteromonas sp. a30]|uniref:S9 family peptidase n=1 Tax=Alteromonas sp. a30 TaxID=2730917 RepID=UPI00228214DF|nr:prolyl oligopeptidase family serine peptidase [Alteromonas sp. a30]MCY7297323.1 S9 family peptidase [Alteromonas sp. a30]